MDLCNRKSSVSNTPFDCLLFDLDDTLYSSKTGISECLKKNIDDFLVEKFGFSRSEAPSLRSQLFKSHGSSLAGLRALGYNVDPDEYHSIVHGRLPYDLIKPNGKLRSILLSVPQRKIVFTNSDIVHARKAMERIGIEDCFEQIICFETMNPFLSQSTCPYKHPVVLKPSPEAMKIALRVGKIDPQRTLFFDDNVHNVAAGKAVGLRTVLVGKGGKIEAADYVLENIARMRKLMPEIWAGSKTTGRVVNNLQSVVGATTVTA